VFLSLRGNKPKTAESDLKQPTSASSSGLWQLCCPAFASVQTEASHRGQKSDAAADKTETDINLPMVVLASATG
jgi:hypothetical protein